MMSGLRSLVLVACCLWPAIGRSDLTLTGYSVTGAFGMPLSSQEQVWIHNSMVRRDFVDRGRAYTHLFDLAKRRLAVIDHASRLVQIQDLTALHAATEATAPTSGLKMTLEPSGQVRPLRHWTCVEHTLNASMPTRLGNEETVFHLKGQVWVASGVPEQAAVKDLVKLARRADFFLGIPTVATVTPAQAQMLSEIVRKLAPMGLPCAGDLEASYEGTGPMANLARRMPTRLGFAFQDFSAEPVKEELFATPAGYLVRP